MVERRVGTNRRFAKAGWLRVPALRRPAAGDLLVETAGHGPQPGPARKPRLANHLRRSGPRKSRAGDLSRVLQYFSKNRDDQRGPTENWEEKTE